MKVQQQRPPNPKPPQKAQMHLQSIIHYGFVFGFGLACGVAAITCLKYSSTSQFNRYFFPSLMSSCSTPPASIKVSDPSSRQPSELSLTIIKDRLAAAPTGLKAFLRRPTSALHEMNDEELLWRASLVPLIKKYPFKRVGKVAFMFLSRGTLPMAPFWDIFFKGVNPRLFTIYIHALSFDSESLLADSVFHGRRIPSQDVHWGEYNMVEAERRLLANALMDFSNQRFVLLSESCIPLFNFSTIYSYLMGAELSFLEAYDEPSSVGRGRYNSLMSPLVTLNQWRKGSQWFEMNRELATEVISDKKYGPVFQSFCQPACYCDEHYLPTLVSIEHWKRNSNRTVTWVDWSHTGPHPGHLTAQNVTAQTLERLRYGKECLYNGEITNRCFLFARKFLPDALDRLLTLAPIVLGD